VAYGQSIADEKTDFRPDSCTLPGALSFSYRSQGSAAGGGRLAQQSPRATDNRTTSPTPTRHLRRFHGPLSRHRIARDTCWRVGVDVVFTKTSTARFQCAVLFFVALDDGSHVHVRAGTRPILP
jgi:hypothetical protein